MKYTCKLDEFIVEVNCDESLQEQAKQLLDDLCKMHRKGPALKDKSTVLYGWVKLRIEQIENVLRVCEPDFLKNRIDDYVPNLDLSLKVLKEQILLLRTLNVEPQPAFYANTLVISRGCLTNDEVYLERQKPSNPNDSGWYIGSTSGDKPTADDLEVIYTHQLLLLRPELMVVLALPESYLAVFSKDKLQEILDDKDNKIWSRN